MTSAVFWVLVISGVGTAGAGFVALLVPRELLRLAFGVPDANGSTLFFARHWGVLIFAVGALVLYSAYAPFSRPAILTAAAVEKFAIVALIFFGPLKRTRLMTAIAVIDGTFATLYVIFLSLGQS